jgi:hypothetical protein
MSEQAKKTIKITCGIEGYEDCYILFASDGWRYKHLRAWEEAKGASNISAIITARIENWHIVIDGAEIPLIPGEGALDELTPELAAWVVTAYRDAYHQAGMPSPN